MIYVVLAEVHISFHPRSLQTSFQILILQILLGFSNGFLVGIYKININNSLFIKEDSTKNTNNYFWCHFK